jgi:hypothetical protein
MFVQLLLAGLDIGLHWSTTVPVARHILGLVGFATAMGITACGILVNRFFLRAAHCRPTGASKWLRRNPTGSCATPATRVAFVAGEEFRSRAERCNRLNGAPRPPAASSAVRTWRLRLN